MRLLLKIGLGLAVAWSGWWVLAGIGVRTGVAAWFEDQSARGWQAEYADIGTGGYPTWHRTRLAYPVLADPTTGVAWRADWLLLESPAIRPGHQVMRFPETGQRLSYFDQTYELAAQDMLAELRVNPAAGLEMSNLAFRSGPWSMTGGQGPLMSGSAATLEMVQTDSPETYVIRFGAPDLTLSRIARSALHSAASFPAEVDTLSLDMTVRFSRSWDMSALTEARPQPRQIKLKLAEMKWGQLALFAAGALNIDEAGRPTGDLTVKAENWKQMLAFAVETGALPGDLARPLERTLRTLARLGGNPDALDVKLTFRNGRMFVGVIPLGPAPRIMLR